MLFNNGLNLTASYAKRSQDGTDPWNLFGKVGYQFLEKHAASVQYSRTENLSAKDDKGDTFGLAYVFSPWKSVEFYGTYYRYMLDRDAASDPDDINRIYDRWPGEILMRTKGMLKLKPQYRMALLISLAIMALLGCNAKPYDYQPTAGEMKEGPGVLTGEDGQFTIYDSKKGGAFPKNSDAKAAETSDEKTAQTTAAREQRLQRRPVQRAKPVNSRNFRSSSNGSRKKRSSTNTSSGRQSSEGSADFKEFQEYQQWQKSAKGSSDFKEFQEYQEWKKSGRSSAEYQEFLEWREFKAYQEWKKRQTK